MIATVGDPATQPFVQAAAWNGEELVEARIEHHCLVEGGRLEFVLGDQPSDRGR